VGQIADATAGEQEGGEDAELGGEVVEHLVRLHALKLGRRCQPDGESNQQSSECRNDQQSA
jgi:hypothetical protein